MKWIFPDAIPAELAGVFKHFSDIETSILFQRGFQDAEDIENFFKADTHDLPKHFLFPDVDKAAKHILKFVKNKSKIFIYGDYDVDGICATAIMFDFLYRTLKADVMPYIPDRFEEGYGLGETGLKYILDHGAKLVITVDCGIRDEKLIKKYKKKGLDFIVTDHHELPVDKKGKVILPKSAISVVHPNLPGSKYPDKTIAGANISWKVVQAINNLLDENERIDTNKYIDLVALATVCDIMPLKGENRIIVRQGLKKMQKDPHPGLKELLNVSGVVNKVVDTYHFGYMIGPRLNAAGRVKHAMEGLRLLTSTKEDEIRESANKLHILNVERQGMTKSLLTESLKQAEKQLAEKNKLLFVYGENWSEGIVGLVAGKLNEMFYLPTLAAGINNEVARGSARSIEGFDITEAISRSESILERFGGHKQAAGFTLKHKNLPVFVKSMQEYAEKAISPGMLEKSIQIDAILEVHQMDDELVDVFDKFKPFGFGNREPVVYLEDLILVNLKKIGKDQQHIKLMFRSSDDKFLTAILFNYMALDRDISIGNEYDILGYVSRSEWNGIKRIEFRIKDLRKSKQKK